MAEAISARGTAVPAQTGGVLSAARGGSVSVSIQDAPTSVGYLAIGTTAADPPATYADLSTDRGGAVVGAGLSLRSTYDADAGLYSLVITQPIGTTTFAEGDVAWAAWFEGSLDTPGPTDVPTLVSAGIPVVA